MAYLLEPTQAILAQQFKEFQSHLKKLKALDDKIEACYEEGKEPPEQLTEEFQKLKEDFMHFRKYFSDNDTDYYFQSEEWDVPRAVRRCIANAYGIPESELINL